VIAAGDAEMMDELKRRIEMLIDDSQIRQHVKDYYSKIAQLEANSNIRQYEAERNSIRWHVDNEAKRLRGSCDRCSKEYIDSHF
jgi:23S rRNA A2030 N6-methylase RlmJ